MEHYSPIKSRLLIYETTWLDLKGIMQSEKNPVSKGYTYCVIPLIQHVEVVACR